MEPLVLGKEAYGPHSGWTCPFPASETKERQSQGSWKRSSCLVPLPRSLHGWLQCTVTGSERAEETAAVPAPPWCLSPSPTGHIAWKPETTAEKQGEQGILVPGPGAQIPGRERAV
jgi:hypothetical protein